MPRRNSPKHRAQHARGKARPQGVHKKARSAHTADGLSQAQSVRDLEQTSWWRPDSERAA